MSPCSLMSVDRIHLWADCLQIRVLPLGPLLFRPIVVESAIYILCQMHDNPTDTFLKTLSFVLSIKCNPFYLPIYGTTQGHQAEPCISKALKNSEGKQRGKTLHERCYYTFQWLADKNLVVFSKTFGCFWQGLPRGTMYQPLGGTNLASFDGSGAQLQLLPPIPVFQANSHVTKSTFF